MLKLVSNFEGRVGLGVVLVHKVHTVYHYVLWDLNAWGFFIVKPIGVHWVWLDRGGGSCVVSTRVFFGFLVRIRGSSTHLKELF